MHRPLVPALLALPFLVFPLVQAAPKTTKTSEFLVLPYLQLPTPTGITVMWETKDELPSTVEYGLTRALGSTAANKKATSLHEVPLRGLRAGTTYYYRVRSGDLVSDIYSFKSAPPFGTKR